MNVVPSVASSGTVFAVALGGHTFQVTHSDGFPVEPAQTGAFYIGMGAAAIGAMLIALFDVKATALGAAGFIGVVSMRPGDMPTFLALAAVTFVIAFAAAYGYGLYLVRKQGTIDPDAPEDSRADAAAAATLREASADALPVAAPLTGEALPVVYGRSLNDYAFAIGGAA